MKTYALLEKRATWIALLLSLPLAPIIAYGFPRMPVGEAFADLEKRSLLTGASEAASKPNVEAELQEIERARQGDIAHATGPLSDYNRSLHASPLFAAPELGPLADCLEMTLGPVVKQYAAVSRRGRSEVLKEGVMQSRWRPETLGRAGYNLAWAAMAEGKVAEAFEWMTEARDVFAAFRTDGQFPVPYRDMDGQLLRLYEAASEILPPGDPLLTSALDQFAQHLLTQVPYYSLAAMIGYQPENYEKPEGVLDDIKQTREHLAAAGGQLGIDLQNLIRPENQEWVRSLTAGRDASRPETGWSIGSIGPPWTFYPALHARFRHLVRTEPNLLSKRLASGAAFPGASPEIAALYSYSVLETLRRWGWTSQHRAQATRVHQLRVANAARRYRRERGEWPKDLSSLVPAYISLPPEATVGGAPDPALELARPGAYPYGPISVGLQDLTRESIPLFLGLQDGESPLTPPSAQWQVAIIGQTSDTLRVMVRLHRQEWAERPLLAFLAAERLTGRVLEATTTVTVHSSNTTEPQVLDRQVAASVTMEPLRMLLGSAACQSIKIPEGLAAIFLSSAVAPSNQIPEAIRAKVEDIRRSSQFLSGPVTLHAEVTIPRKAFALWVEGRSPPLTLFLPER